MLPPVSQTSWVPAALAASSPSLSRYSLKAGNRLSRSGPYIPARALGSRKMCSLSAIKASISYIRLSSRE